MKSKLIILLLLAAISFLGTGCDQENFDLTEGKSTVRRSRTNSLVSQVYDLEKRLEELALKNRPPVAVVEPNVELFKETKMGWKWLGKDVYAYAVRLRLNQWGNAAMRVGTRLNVDTPISVVTFSNNTPSNITETEGVLKSSIGKQFISGVYQSGEIKIHAGIMQNNATHRANVYYYAILKYTKK